MGRGVVRREGGKGSGEKGKRTVSSENPVDTHYKGLDVNLDALDSGDSDFKVCLREDEAGPIEQGVGGGIVYINFNPLYASEPNFKGFFFA